jgi:hypothetical protein
MREREKKRKWDMERERETIERIFSRHRKKTKTPTSKIFLFCVLVI